MYSVLEHMLGVPSTQLLVIMQIELVQQSSSWIGLFIAAVHLSW